VTFALTFPLRIIQHGDKQRFDQRACQPRPTKGAFVELAD